MVNERIFPSLGEGMLLMCAHTSTPMQFTHLAALCASSKSPAPPLSFPPAGKGDFWLLGKLWFLKSQGPARCRRCFPAYQKSPLEDYREKMCTTAPSQPSLEVPFRYLLPLHGLFQLLDWYKECFFFFVCENLAPGSSAWVRAFGFGHVLV